MSNVLPLIIAIGLAGLKVIPCNLNAGLGGGGATTGTLVSTGAGGFVTTAAIDTRFVGTLAAATGSGALARRCRTARQPTKSATPAVRAMRTGASRFGRRRGGAFGCSRGAEMG